MDKPVIDKKNAIYYISTGDIIRFIFENNSGMSWNECCNFVGKYGIVGEEGNICWYRSDVFASNAEKDYNSDAIHWIRRFFNAHDWMHNIMIVFDD